MPAWPPDSSRTEATSTPSPTATPTRSPTSGRLTAWRASGRARAAPTSTRSPRAPSANAFVEHYELQPIDPQTNGPQLFYGLRYHTHIVKPGEVETFHDQVGYWLWEPATGIVTLTLGDPARPGAARRRHAPNPTPPSSS